MFCSGGSSWPPCHSPIIFKIAFYGFRHKNTWVVVCYQQSNITTRLGNSKLKNVMVQLSKREENWGKLPCSNKQWYSIRNHKHIQFMIKQQDNFSTMHTNMYRKINYSAWNMNWTGKGFVRLTAKTLLFWKPRNYLFLSGWSFLLKNAFKYLNP